MSFLWSWLGLDGGFEGAGIWRGLILGLLFNLGACALILSIGRICWEEARSRLKAPPLKGRLFLDADQSKKVRRIAPGLGARNRDARLEAVRTLCLLNDASAVPALHKALERHNDDVPFVMEIVETLAALEDPRALSALRLLTSGRHYRLMEAARRAVSAIEAKSSLLRGASAPVQKTDALLRPAKACAAEEADQLLRSEPIKAQIKTEIAVELPANLSATLATREGERA